MTSVDRSSKSPGKASLLNYFKRLNPPKSQKDSEADDSINSEEENFQDDKALSQQRTKKRRLQTHKSRVKSSNGARAIILEETNEKVKKSSVSSSPELDRKGACDIASDSNASQSDAGDKDALKAESDANDSIAGASMPNSDIDKESVYRAEENVETNVRRSSRLQRKSEIRKELSMLEDSMSEESAFQEKPSKKRKSKVESKRQTKENAQVSDTESKDKSCLKIAPLFLFSKKKPRKSEEDVYIVEELDVVAPITPMTEERKAFLMSGVPEILKQKQPAFVDEELMYPPISGGIHIQKLTDEELLVNGCHDKKVSVTLKSPDEINDVIQAPIKFSSQAAENRCNIDACSVQIRCLSKSEISEHADQIKNDLPKFPIRKYYNKLVLRKKDFDQRVKRSTLVENIDCSYHYLPWTDKYGASIDTAILAKNDVVSKLKTWLNLWKKKTASDEKKLHKDASKRRKSGSKSNHCNEDSDDDFISKYDYGSDSSDEEYSLPVAYVITGPHGCGKTSVVYALAELLNYKVFEVNTSSKRSGKNISHQLQEAMKSQHVAKDQLSSVFSTFEMMRVAKLQSAEVIKTPPPSNKKRKADALANFFQPKTKRTKTEEEDSKSGASPRMTQLKERENSERSDEKLDKSVSRKVSRREKEEKYDKPEIIEEEKNDYEDPRPKRKRGRPPRGRKSEVVEEIDLEELDTSLVASEKSTGLTLESCSLILFDEVDLVFEEDKGFWSTIQTFIEVNKRPIILTCTNPSIAAELGPDVEVVKIKAPTVATLTGYLSAICLAEKKYVPVSDLRLLVKMFDCDVRRCLLWLQWRLAFSCDHLVFPIIQVPNILRTSSAEVLGDHLKLLPARQRIKPNTDTEMKSEDTEERKQDASFLDVFDDDRQEQEEASAPPPAPVSLLQDSDWPTVDKFASSCLRSVADFLDDVCVADVLNPRERLQLVDTCEDSIRDDEETSSLGVSELIEDTSHRIALSKLDDVRNELKQNEELLKRLPEPPTDTQENSSHNLFNEVQKAVINALPSSNSIARRTVCTDYIPYLCSISKFEEFKRLSLSKRRFFHHFDRISLNIEEDIRELMMYTDFS